MRTIAHILSENSMIDPAYSAEKVFPEPHVPGEFPYLYGPEDFLCARLEEMRKAVKKAALKVGYPGEHRTPSRQLFFVSEYEGGPGKFRCPGGAMLYLNGMEIPVNFNNGLFTFTAPKGVLTAVIFGDAATFQPLWHAKWGCAPDANAPAVPAEEHFCFSCDDTPPHQSELPTVNLTPKKLDCGLYDAGCEILAYVTIHTHDVDCFRPGETKEEAMEENPENFEQSSALEEIMPGVWRSAVPLAFRYLRLETCGLEKVLCHAIFTPECYRGAFASGDKELDDIWMCSAYTLRLCHRHFLIDGVKRDRLPWSGDLRISLLSSCFTFADTQIVEDTLQLLGDFGLLSHINGLTDYTLWYIINHDTWQLYSGRQEFLIREYPKILQIMEKLTAAEEPETGFLKPGQWTLIDWFEFEKSSSLQMLWCWALKAASALARRMNDAAHETLWRTTAEKAASQIRAAFRDPATGIYRDGKEDRSIHRYANFLALLSGVETDAAPIAALLAKEEIPAVGTPYMAAMEIKALADAGYRELALQKLRTLWGAMLKDGATTFYEAYDFKAAPENRHSFYQRPFGLSLCHAWGAGPAWLLPELFFGIRPLEDGWKKFTANPGSFVKGEVHLTVPVPGGEIELALEAGRLSVKAPESCVFDSVR